MIEKIEIGKDPLTNIAPLEFLVSKVWYKIREKIATVEFFKEDARPTRLPCIVYEIPNDWQVCTWFFDNIGNLLF